MSHKMTGTSFSKSETGKSDFPTLMIEPFAFENIFYEGSQIGKGFRERYARIILDIMVDGVIIFDEPGVWGGSDGNPKKWFCHFIETDNSKNRFCRLFPVYGDYPKNIVSVHFSIIRHLVLISLHFHSQDTFSIDNSYNPR